MTKGFVRALAAFGVLAAVMLVGQANAAPVYPPSIATSTDLDLADATVQPGETTTATVTVTAGSGQPQGTVTFRVSGRQGQTMPLVDGEASWETPADLAPGRTYKITARYNGTGGSQAMGAETDGVASMIALVSSDAEAGFRPSQDVAYLTVAAGDVTGGDDNVAAAAAGDNAGLPSVGQSASTQIAMFAGVGLVAAGLFSLALYRRRVSL